MKTSDLFAYVAKLLSRVGGVAITAAISPYEGLRKGARHEIPYFIEVYIKCPMGICIVRDVKGHYEKSLVGKIKKLHWCF